MKCPECTGELINVEEMPFGKTCQKCNVLWIIQTMEQSIQMGILNTALLARNDLTTDQKIKLIVNKAHELEKHT